MKGEPDPHPNPPLAGDRSSSLAPTAASLFTGYPHSLVTRPQQRFQMIQVALKWEQHLLVDVSFPQHLAQRSTLRLHRRQPDFALGSELRALSAALLGIFSFGFIDAPLVIRNQL